METVANWGVRPVFITSTFQDMKAERNLLWDIVSPAIETELRRYRRHLEWIDLRLGADATSTETEAEREALVLKVCLDEVKRSRPFLVALIGDRYGWIPPHDRAAAAAREANITGDVTGRSVTDLEIDFGVFHDPEQRRRSLFFLRGPLPYADMGELAARYSDEYRTDSDAPKCVDGLKALKQRISGSFEPHVFRYTAAWDAATQQVDGLEAFGEQVTAAILAQLRVELAEEAAPAELTWQQQEASALDEFAADRRRDFQGRQALLNDIADFLTAPTQPDAIWARCLSGTAGSGKSAVFSEILARLHAIQAAAKPRDSALSASARQADDAMREWVGKLATDNPPFVALQGRLDAEPVLVLAHAAGASPRAPSVDAMLRRWISELAAFLGVPDGLADNADAEAVENAFASLLGRAALRRRVVVLIDALDQLEQTPRGRFLAWLPKFWPDNARLFTTAIAGEASKALAQRQPGSHRTLDKLSRDEAREVYLAIHRRYHRNADEELCAVLLGRPEEAWSNPLWLYLAVEQLNLLDGDDVAEAERGDPAQLPQRLKAMLSHRATDFPPDLQGLYRVTFDHAARWFPKLAPWFLGLIAVGAGGWRESDFRAVLPELSGVSWDDLHFAYLRRLFRGQIRPRGVLEQWDVAHAQMREAMRGWLADRGVVEKGLHAALAMHLYALPVGDPLRETDTIRHLLGADELALAAIYFSDPELPAQSVVSAAQFLAEAWIADRPELQVRARVTKMLSLGVSPSNILEYLASRMLFDVHDVMAAAGRLQPVCDFLTVLRSAILSLVNLDPSNADWQRYLSIVCGRSGDVLILQGSLELASKFYQESHLINKRLEMVAAGIMESWHDLSVSHNHLGDVLMAQGNLHGALEAYLAGLEIRKKLTLTHQSDERWQRELSVSYNKVGGILKAEGKTKDALQAFHDSLAIRERLARGDPSDASKQRDLSVSYDRLAGAWVDNGQLQMALHAFQDSLKIRERMISVDPGNLGYQRDLSVSFENIGNVLLSQGQLSGAFDYHHAELTIATSLVQTDPGNAVWQNDLQQSWGHIGDVLVAKRQMPEALEAYNSSLSIVKKLIEAELGSDEIKSDISALYMKIGSVNVELGQRSLALQLFRDSLTVREQLALSNPDNPIWQRSLIVALTNIAKLSSGDARGMLNRAKQIADGLKNSGRLAPSDALLPHELERRLKALPNSGASYRPGSAANDAVQRARVLLAANDAAGAAALLADAPRSPGLPNARAVCALRLGDPHHAIDLIHPAILPDGASSPPDATPDSWIVTYATALALVDNLSGASRALEWVKNFDDRGAVKLRAALAAWRKSLSWKEAMRYRFGSDLPRAITLDYPPGELW